VADFQRQRIRPCFGFLIFFIFFSFACIGQSQEKLKNLEESAVFVYSSLNGESFILEGKLKLWALQKVAEKPDRNHKVNAVLLAIGLGPFGVHRLYLGTHPRVPVIYTLTLGGGLGILPLTDIIAIIATKDLSKFIGNDRVIMWAK
jgi:TM2 domain-containing membrane protein YozV